MCKGLKLAVVIMLLVIAGIMSLGIIYYPVVQLICGENISKEIVLTSICGAAMIAIVTIICVTFIVVTCCKYDKQKQSSQPIAIKSIKRGNNGNNIEIDYEYRH